MENEVSKRTIGINKQEDGSFEVSVWAPLADQVKLKLVQSGEILPLTRNRHGYWHTTSRKLASGDRYKFILNQDKELPDPASLHQPEGVHGPSAVVDLQNFPWSDGSWKNFSLREYIFYELHTGTFSKPGTFDGVRDRLKYLKELGITAIEIMPVSQFPGDRNWGYDGVFPFAVQNSYGGPFKLMELVDSCHREGLAVVLDVVYNHLGPEGNYLGSYGPYFTSKYNTPWGGALNFDDAWCDGVREFFIQNALMWFRDFHIDALRLDAVHAIKDFSTLHILEEIRMCTDDLIRQTGRRHHLIVELDLNDTRFIKSRNEGGFGMDAQWIDEFHHALRVTAGGDRSGYYSDFNGLPHLAKAYQDAYVFNGQYSEHRKKKFGTKTSGRPGEQFIVFSQNHDQIGNRMLGERMSVLTSYEMQKLLAAAVVVSPFLPMFFMGEEWGEENPFQYFVSHTDPELAEAVRKGRKEEFSDFHLIGEAPDPMSIETFTRSKLNWQMMESGKNAIMLQYYRYLIQLRKTDPVLAAPDRENLFVTTDENANTITLQRWKGLHHLLAILNFSDSKQQINPGLPGHRLQLVLNSASPMWGGPVGVEAGTSLLETGTVTIAPESCLFYSTTHV